MRLALVPVAPFTLLGFAAVTARSMRTPTAKAVGRQPTAISIGTSPPMLAACRVDIDFDAETELEYAPVRPQHTPTGVAVLRFTITPTGDFREIEVVTPSGFPALDAAAVRLVSIARVDASTPGTYRATVVFTE